MDEIKKPEVFDSLLECLLILANRYKKINKSDFLADFPKENMTYSLFLRAAAKLNFNAKLNKALFSKLYNVNTDLPVILLLEGGQACILKGLKRNYAYIVNDKGEKQRVATADLEQAYQGQYFQLTPILTRGKQSGKQTPTEILWRLILKNMPAYSEVFVASFLINIFTLALPLFIMNVYDKVIPNSAYETLWTLGTAVLIILVFDFVIRELRTYFVDNSSRRISNLFSSILFEQLLNIKNSARPGSVGTMVNSMQSFDVIAEFLSSTSVMAVVDFPFVITFLIIIYFLAGWLVIIPLAAIPVVLVVSFWNQLRVTKVLNKMVELNSAKQSILIESLQNINDIKMTGSEIAMQTRWEDLIDKLSHLSVKNLFFNNLSTNISLFAQYLVSVAVVIGGVYLITAGSLKLGELIACTILTGRALAPLVQLTMSFARYRQAKASLNLVETILKLPVERPPEKNFLAISNLNGDIEFADVSFSYPKQQTDAVENISFTVHEKERVGIVGPTGSGKSTLLKLLLHFYEPTEGNILVNGIDSDQLDPTELRQFISYVPQEVSLFQGSIKDNLKVGNYGIDDDKLLHAAELSGLASYLKKTTEGFNRDVGERGLRLSGGERQLIAITRALLKNSPLLVLDEPTNGMDQLAINHFLSNLNVILQNKTLILVTHQIFLLRLVSRLIVVSHGKIVADGPRDEILKRIQTEKLA